MAIPIGKYQLHNNGVAIDIWPQLRDAKDSNKILWDPRNNGDNSTYELHITQTKGWDLSQAGLQQGQEFFVAANVRWGDDKICTSQSFVYDASSAKQVNARADGGARDGTVVIDGYNS